MLTYNNAIVEERENGRRVYLPQYGFSSLDKAARQMWRALNFTVVPVAGFTSSAFYGGALRCSVKVLRRRVSAK